MEHGFETILEMLEKIGQAVGSEIEQSLQFLSEPYETHEDDIETEVDELVYLQFAELANRVAFGIRKIIFAEKKTIVLFEDGTKQIATCQEGDTYSKETGVMVCILKRIYGNGINRLLDDIADETEKAENGESTLVYIQKANAEKSINQDEHSD